MGQWRTMSECASCHPIARVPHFISGPTASFAHSRIAGIAPLPHCLIARLTEGPSTSGRHCVLATIGAAMKDPRHACPCCGYLTLSAEPPGTFEICPVCFWEDDDVQFRDVTCTGGANEVSLVDARRNFLISGAASKKYEGQVRPPLPEEKH